jgi:hypothetical protein
VLRRDDGMAVLGKDTIEKKVAISIYTYLLRYCESECTTTTHFEEERASLVLVYLSSVGRSVDVVSGQL